MKANITILAPESELPAEGAEISALAKGNAPDADALLAAYGELLESSSLTFRIDAKGSIQFDGRTEAEDFIALELSGEQGDEPNVSVDASTPAASLDFTTSLNSISTSFDVESGRQQLAANIASTLRGELADEQRHPVPLIRWSASEEDQGGVAQLLGVWLADDDQMETLRKSGNEGIIFDEAEVEGRGMRETLTAFTVLGIMMAGTVSAEAGLFRRKAKKKAKTSEKSSRYRQDPVKIDRRALSNTSPSKTTVIVDVSKQRAYVIADGLVVLDTPVSTAREGKYTPRGEFKITQRVKTGKTSTIYGCDLPYWMRLNESAIGLHVGDLPGYPASAGCIRLPAEVAPVVFGMTKSGTTVKVVDSWQPEIMLASN